MVSCKFTLKPIHWCRLRFQMISMVLCFFPYPNRLGLLGFWCQGGYGSNWCSTAPCQPNCTKHEVACGNADHVARQQWTMVIQEREKERDQLLPIPLRTALHLHEVIETISENERLIKTCRCLLSSGESFRSTPASPSQMDARWTAVTMNMLPGWSMKHQAHSMTAALPHPLAHSLTEACHSVPACKGCVAVSRHLVELQLSIILTCPFAIICHSYSIYRSCHRAFTVCYVCF